MAGGLLPPVACNIISRMAGPIPGTVSKILWHFTGGPAWNARLRRQARDPKHPASAYKALIAILTGRELRLGSYREIVTVEKPRRHRLRGAVTLQRAARIRQLQSSPVCCLADVPIMHLSYLASRYGKFAIGFHRDAAMRHGFNPVFYTLQNSELIRSLYGGFGRISGIDMDGIRAIARDIRETLQQSNSRVDIGPDFANLELIADMFEQDVDVGRGSIQSFLAFVKTFSRRDLQTIYCEREWRSVNSFLFKWDNVAMIVLPKYDRGGHYFTSFTKSRASQLDVPRSIPVVPWEDLIES